MKNFGFTLMELMIVIGLMMILSVVGIGSFTQATIKSKDSERKNNINQMVKAVESFYTDIGRYPLSLTNESYMHCYVKLAGVITNTTCDNNRLYSLIDGIVTSYIVIPSDPDPARKFVYISDGSSYAFYTALENTADKDLIVNADGSVNQDPWGVNCGSVSCNYKVTESGLVKSL